MGQASSHSDDAAAPLAAEGHGAAASAVAADIEGGGAAGEGHAAAVANDDSDQRRSSRRQRPSPSRSSRRSRRGAGEHEGAQEGYSAMENAVANNFGMGQSFWSPASPPPPPVARRDGVALAGGDQAEAAFPVIPPRATLSALLADGLQPDLAFQPYQLPRLTGAWQNAAAAAAAGIGGGQADAAAQPKERTAIRCKNTLQLFKSSVTLEPLPSAEDGVAVAPDASPPTAAAAPAVLSSSPADSGNACTRFGLSFTIDTKVAARVRVHWLVNEVCASGMSIFVPNAAAAAAIASSSSSAAVAAAGGAVPLSLSIPAQYFSAGRHTVRLPVAHALDISHLSELHLHHSARLSYFPLVIVLEEASAAASGASGGGGDDSKEEFEALASRAPSSSVADGGPLRVRSLTSYFTLQRRNGGSLLGAKLLSQTAVLSSGLRYAINELYSGAGDEGKEGSFGASAAAANAAAAQGSAMSAAGTVVSGLPPSASSISNAAVSGGVGECVVCLVETKDTAILPCRHMCLCHECARIVKRQTPPRCPVCRAQVGSTVRITSPAQEGPARN